MCVGIEKGKTSWHLSVFEPLQLLKRTAFQASWEGRMYGPEPISRKQDSQQAGCVGAVRTSH